MIFTFYWFNKYIITHQIHHFSPQNAPLFRTHSAFQSLPLYQTTLATFVWRNKDKLSLEGSSLCFEGEPIVKKSAMERAKFRSITRGENESVMKFEARLRHGVRNCGYTGATLNDCLVEQFIQGINNKAIAKKLLEKEGTMSQNEAVEIANSVLLIEAGSNGATASASAFHTVKKRLKELWLELLQPNVFGVIAKVITRVTRKNVEL